MSSRQVRKAIEKIPEHLLPYTTRQNADLYTAIDHAAWRFIMKLSSDFFPEHAHPIYLEGLKATGISLERIPRVEEMDKALRKFGWRAVNVSGFIPPAAFLEFLALGILPIACEMRKVENLNYTPAPDIVHEAAGHAPILADREYADYVRLYGEIACKAIFSQKDLDLFEAIRLLSDIKEKPTSTEAQIQEAQKKFEQAYAALDYVSESTQLARMSWWTIEYGMIGDLNKPLIYGAGLLSSMGESYHCLDENVKKIPFTEDCVLQSYDITRPQPQLYVSPSVASMKKVLLDYAKKMAYQVGGTYALAKAKHAASVTTTVFDNALQVSGVLKNFSTDAKDHPVFLEWQGPLQISVGDKELKEWKTAKLPQSLISPLGAPSSFRIGDKLGKNWEKIKWSTFKKQTLEARYKSGFKLQAKIGQSFALKGKTLFVELEGVSFFNPYTQESRNFDRILLILAKSVPSVFGGAADRVAFIHATEGTSYVSNEHVSNYDRSAIQALIDAYELVRDAREGKKKASAKDLESLVDFLATSHPHEWLLRWELLELDQEKRLHSPWRSQLKGDLEKLKKLTPQNEEVIERALRFLIKRESHLMTKALHA
jgi:phenylalanine-4-hydroxylase